MSKLICAVLLLVLASLAISENCDPPAATAIRSVITAKSAYHGESRCYTYIGVISADYKDIRGEVTAYVTTDTFWSGTSWSDLQEGDRVLLGVTTSSGGPVVTVVTQER